jgi:hypothetical protein|tara:strand:+ start:27204 stop:27434 length:231 start_codon:yes stop_codon:yes gene_type:complete
MKVGDLVVLSKRELGDLVSECGLDSTTDITKDYGVGVVIKYQTDNLSYPWIVHWFPLNESQNEKANRLEIITQARL